MSDALEWEIEQALLEALRGILVENGYYTDLGDNVLDAPEAEDTIEESRWPYCYTLPGAEAPDDGCDGGRYGSVFEFFVVAYMSAPTTEIAALMARVKADVKKAVLTDPSLGLGTGTNEADWGGANRAIEVADGRSIAKVALRFLIGSDWSPQAA